MRTDSLGWITERVVPHLDELGEWRDARLLEESQRIFSPPVEIAEVAAHAGVARLVFSSRSERSEGFEVGAMDSA